MIVHMFATKDSHHGVEFFNNIHDSIRMVRMYDAVGQLYEIEVSPHPDQTRGKRDTAKQEYWGWVKTGETMYSMVYPSYAQFSMCFAYGFAASEERGNGKAYRLQVREIRMVDKR